MLYVGHHQSQCPNQLLGGGPFCFCVMTTTYIYSGTNIVEFVSCSDNIQVGYFSSMVGFLPHIDSGIHVPYILWLHCSLEPYLCYLHLIMEGEKDHGEGSPVS